MSTDPHGVKRDAEDSLTSADSSKRARPSADEDEDLFQDKPSVVHYVRFGFNADHRCHQEINQRFTCDTLSLPRFKTRKQDVIYILDKLLANRDPEVNLALELLALGFNPRDLDVTLKLSDANLSEEQRMAIENDHYRMITNLADTKIPEFVRHQCCLDSWRAGDAIEFLSKELGNAFCEVETIGTWTKTPNGNLDTLDTPLKVTIFNTNDFV